MKVKLIVVPPGGGRYEYSIDFEMPAVPRAGEYITLARDKDLKGSPRDEDGAIAIYSCFYVRQVWWDLRHPGDGLTAKPDEIGSADMIAVEVEDARGPHMTASHRRACDVWEQKGHTVRTFESAPY